MCPVNILKIGSKLESLFANRVSRVRLNGAKVSPCPAKIYYLWEKHDIKRIELFSME